MSGRSRWVDFSVLLLLGLSVGVIFFLKKPQNISYSKNKPWLWLNVKKELETTSMQQKTVYYEEKKCGERGANEMAARSAAMTF